MVVWIKRVSPLVLIALAWFAYTHYTAGQAEREETAIEQYALITAQVWIASAKFRENPDRFLGYRDSLLKVNLLTTDSLDSFLEEYKNEPEGLTPFARMVKGFVDSLIAIEDSLAKPDSQIAADSALPAATSP